MCHSVSLVTHAKPINKGFKNDTAWRRKTSGCRNVYWFVGLNRKIWVMQDVSIFGGDTKLVVYSVCLPRLRLDVGKPNT